MNLIQDISNVINIYTINTRPICNCLHANICICIPHRISILLCLRKVTLLCLWGINKKIYKWSKIKND